MELQEILNKLNSAIDKYHTLQLNLVADQSELLRQISTCLYYLEVHRVDAHKEWQRVYFASKATSHAAKEREADNSVKDLYLIRRIMNGANIVKDSIRSTISVHKAER